MTRARITLEWNDHTDKVPHASDRWASSDRGWLFATLGKTHIHYGTDYITLGHYLDYGGCEGYAEKTLTVHAVSCVDRSSAHFATVTEARAWIEAQSKGREARYFAECHRTAGGYLHNAQKIAATEVAR